MLNAEGHERGGPFDTTKLVCSGCGKDVWPRVGGYWFLLLAPRGRVRFPGAVGAEVVLCSGCGRRVREALEGMGVTGPAYRPRAASSRGFVTGP